MSDGVVVKHLLSTSFPMLGWYFLLQEKTLMLWNKIADQKTELRYENTAVQFFNVQVLKTSISYLNEVNLKSISQNCYTFVFDSK